MRKTSERSPFSILARVFFPFFLLLFLAVCLSARQSRPEKLIIVRGLARASDRVPLLVSLSLSLPACRSHAEFIFTHD